MLLWGGVGLFTLERPLPSDQDKAGGKEVENMENKSEEEEGHLCDGGEDEDVGDVIEPCQMCLDAIEQLHWA